MTVKLALEECETSISQMGDDRTTWTIVTDDPLWLRRLEKMGFTPTQQRGPTCWFHVPATCVIVRKEPKVKPMSDENRAKASERMRLLLQAQEQAKISKGSDRP